jgi:hypothetical protein
MFIVLPRAMHLDLFNLVINWSTPLQYLYTLMGISSSRALWIKSISCPTLITYFPSFIKLSSWFYLLFFSANYVEMV